MCAYLSSIPFPSVHGPDVGQRVFEITHLAARVHDLAVRGLAFGLTRKVLLAVLKALHSTICRRGSAQSPRAATTPRSSTRHEGRPRRWRYWVNWTYQPFPFLLAESGRDRTLQMAAKSAASKGGSAKAKRR